MISAGHQDTTITAPIDILTITTIQGQIIVTEATTDQATVMEITINSHDIIRVIIGQILIRVHTTIILHTLRFAEITELFKVNF